MYRGLKGAGLPQEFFTPNEHNVRGGVEFSFMSCSKSRGVAMQYATHKGEDRGAPRSAARSPAPCDRHVAPS